MKCDFCHAITDPMHVERRAKLVRRNDGLDPSVVVFCAGCCPSGFGMSTPWLVLPLCFVMARDPAELVGYINDKIRWANAVGNGADRTLAAMRDAREIWISRN